MIWHYEVTWRDMRGDGSTSASGTESSRAQARKAMRRTKERFLPLARFGMLLPTGRVWKAP